MYYHHDLAEVQGNQDRNREAESGTVRMKMLDYKIKSSRRSKSRASKKKKVGPRFQLMLEELRSPNRKVVIREHPNGRVDLRFSSEKSNVVVQLISDDHGVYVHDLRGSRAFAAKQHSLERLIQEHPDYFKTKFFPLFQHLGIVIDPVLIDPKFDGVINRSFWNIDDY